MQTQYNDIAQNLVKNGNFSDGLSYWCTSIYEPYIYTEHPPESQGWTFDTVCFAGPKGNPVSIYQFLTTTPGKMCVVKFYLGSMERDDEGSFSVILGNEIREIIPSPIPNFPATYYELKFRATCPTTKFGFIVKHINRYFCIGGVEVIQYHCDEFPDPIIPPCDNCQVCSDIIYPPCQLCNSENLQECPLHNPACSVCQQICRQLCPSMHVILEFMSRLQKKHNVKRQ